MFVSRGDVSCGEEKRRLGLRGEYGKLNRRIFKSASSIDSLQIDIYIFNRHTSSIDIPSIDISSIGISSIGVYLQSTYPVVQDMVVRGVGVGVRGVRVLVPVLGSAFRYRYFASAARNRQIRS